MGLQSIQSGYLTRTAVIMLLCALDCCINAVADHPAAGAPGFMPFVFLGVQLALQVVNLLLVFMLFSGTYLFQVGLVGVQVREFCGLLGCALAYMAVYVTYAAYKCVRVRRRGAPRGRRRRGAAPASSSLPVPPPSLPLTGPLPHFNPPPPRTHVQSLLPSVGVDGLWDVPAFVFLSLAQKLASLLYYLVMLAVCSRMGEVVWYSRAAWIQRFSGAPSAV